MVSSAIQEENIERVAGLVAITTAPTRPVGIQGDGKMKTILTICCAAALTGCATWSTSSVDTKQVATNASAQTTSSKITADKVKITDGDLVDTKYVLLGDLTVNVNKTTLFHPNPTPQLVNDKLREKAAEMGADAVIFFRYGDGGISLLSWGSLEGKGRAVRYVK